MAKNFRLLLNLIKENLFALPMQAKLVIIVSKTPRPGSINTKAPVYSNLDVMMCREFVKRWVNTIFM